MCFFFFGCRYFSPVPPWKWTWVSSHMVWSTIMVDGPPWLMNLKFIQECVQIVWIWKIQPPQKMNILFLDSLFLFGWIWGCVSHVVVVQTCWKMQQLFSFWRTQVVARIRQWFAFWMGKRKGFQTELQFGIAGTDPSKWKLMPQDCGTPRHKDPKEVVNRLSTHAQRGCAFVSLRTKQ